MLQPEKWVDRDFGMDIQSAERMLARVLGLNRSQVIELRRPRTEPYNGDLGAFVERVVVSMEKVSGISYFIWVVWVRVARVNVFEFPFDGLTILGESHSVYSYIEEDLL